MLVAKTTSPHGIAAINTYLMGISTIGVTYGTGINAATTEGGPFITGSNPVNLIYFQDLTAAGVVTGVGAPSFSPGPDSLGQPGFEDATRIAAGTYPSAVPSFSMQGGLVSDANVLSASVPPFRTAIDATTTAVARVAIVGDYNLNGVVDPTDYVVWRDAFGGSVRLPNDATTPIDAADYTVWRDNFEVGTAVSWAPEPTGALLAAFGLLAAWFLGWSCGLR